MIKVALRGVRSNLVRFILSVLAVVLGVAFVAGTFSLRSMMSATFTGIVETSMIGDAYLRGANPTPDALTGFDGGSLYNAIPLDLAEKAEQLPEVQRAIPDITGSIVVVGADGTAVLQGGAPSFAFALEPDDPVVSIADGRAPKGSNEIALESSSLTASGLHLGDKTTAVIDGEIYSVTVVGEISFDAPVAGATLTFLDAQFARQMFAADGLVGSITVFAAPGITETALTAALTEQLISPDADTAAAVTAVTGAQQRAESVSEIEEMLGFVETFLLVFAAISLFVGGFIIANTFVMSVRQRQGELALLRALGASPTQVFASVLAQAAIIGAIGSVLGVAGGVGLVALLRIAFEQMGMTMSGEIPLDSATVVISVVIGTLVSAAAAIMPARRAARIAPVEAMRDGEAEVEKSLAVRALIGTLLLAAGGGLVIASLVGSGDGRGALLGYGACATVAAALVLAPVIARPVMAVLAAPAVAAFKPGGKLAGRNVVRNRRRTASTAGALMIGMALVGAASVIAASAQASVRTVVENESRADLIIESAVFTVPAGAISAVSALPTVDRADSLAVSTVAIGDETAVVTALPHDAFGKTLVVQDVAGSASALAPGEVAALAGSARDFGWSIGDRVELRGATGTTATVRIGAIVESRVVTDMAMYLPPEVFEAVVPRAADSVTAVLLTAAPNVDIAQLRNDVVEAVKPFVVVSVLDNDEFANQLAEQVDAVLVVLYALLGLAVIIAVLGVANTLALSVIERTREVGLLRAVGLGRLQVAGTVALEAVLIAVFGAVLGVALGVGLAAAMPTVFADIGLTSLVIPWANLAVVVAVAALGGLVAALWPAVRAARLPVLTAVSYD